MFSQETGTTGVFFCNGELPVVGSENGKGSLRKTLNFAIVVTNKRTTNKFHA